MKRISAVLMVAMMLCGIDAVAQPSCMGLRNPVNFIGWYGKTGIRSSGTSTASTIYNTASTSTTKITWMQMPTIVTTGNCGSGCNHGNAPDNNKNRFQIINQQGGDAHTGGALQRIPPGRASCIRIGDMCSSSGNSGDAIFYEVDVTADNALVFIDYACVMEAPTHGPTGNPEFIIRVCRQTNPATDTWATTPISDSLYYIVQAPNGVTNLPAGWSGYTGTSSCKYVYKPWTKVAINLYKYLYQKVRIEMYISDCNAQFHGAYAYISGTCQPMRLEANGCAAGETEDVATIKAPAGLSAYQWYKSRTGFLTGAASTDPNNYVMIPGQVDSILNVTTSHLTVASGDTVARQSFMCEMTSYMDPTKPVKSQLYTDVMNKKPKLTLDTILTCDREVTLIDRSQAPIVERPDDNVDTSKTVWIFYNHSDTIGGPDTIVYGGKGYHKFPRAGNYAVTVRTSARDTSCWNQKTVMVRALAPPARPGFLFERNDICFRDTIAIGDTTVDSDWRRWVLKHSNGTTDTIEDTARTIHTSFDSTEIVEIIVAGVPANVSDTNGNRIQVVCTTIFYDTIRVGTYPKLVVEGDTVVCIGSSGEVSVRVENVTGCTFEWHNAMGSNTPFSTSDHITVSPRRSTWYYVKVTTHPNECLTWDSIFVRVVDPTLTSDKTEICTGDTVWLTAGNAYSYSWRANPQDTTLDRWNDDSVTHPVIPVSPSVTTTYTMIGHGINGCNSNPLSITVTVYPYPIPRVEYDPNFIDSEDPSVTFHDLSENGVRTLWNFGDGSTSTMRDATYTFTDLNHDSVTITLYSTNALGCVSDTSFRLPVVLFTAWLPNTFTPALGGENSLFRIYSGNNLEFYSMYIYDRAGNLVFTTHDQHEGWDGTNLHGGDCKEGIYVYVCSYRRPNTTDITTRKGSLLLIR